MADIDLQRIIIEQGYPHSITTRAKNCLYDLQIETLEEFLVYDCWDLRKVPGIGKGTIRQLVEIQKYFLSNSTLVISNSVHENSQNWNINEEIQKIRNTTFKTIPDPSKRLERALSFLGINNLVEFLTLNPFHVRRAPNVGRETQFELKELQNHFKTFLVVSNEDYKLLIKEKKVETQPGFYQKKIKVFKQDELPIYDYPEISKNTDFEELAETFWEALEQIFSEYKGASRNALIFCQRYGFDSSFIGLKTLSEIGDSYNLSRERIRQITKKQVGKFKYYFRRKMHSETRNKIYSCILSVSSLEEISNAEAVARLLLFKFDWPESKYATLLWLIYQIFRLFPKKEKSMAAKSAAILANRQKEKERRLSAKINADETLNKLLEHCYFPINAQKTNDEWFSSSKRSPEILIPEDEFDFETFDRSSYKGRFFSQKNSKFVYYDSRLEKRVLNILEKSSVNKFCEQPFKIAYKDQLGINRFYIPDCIVELQNSACVLIEVKPYATFLEMNNVLKYLAGAKFANCIGIAFHVMDDKGLSLNALAGREIRPNFENGVKDKINELGELPFKDLLNLRSNHGAKSIDISSVAVRNDFCILRGPWRLVPLPEGASYASLIK